MRGSLRQKKKSTAQEVASWTDENAKDELEAAKIALAQLTEAAQLAAQKRERAELDFAEANLRRQEKLLRLGSAQKSDVITAEAKTRRAKAAEELKAVRGATQTSRKLSAWLRGTSRCGAYFAITMSPLWIGRGKSAQRIVMLLKFIGIPPPPSSGLSVIWK